MAYTHLTIDELTWIECYFNTGIKVVEIAKKLERSNQTIYNVINFLKQGYTVIEYHQRYRENKQRCGAKKKEFTENQIQYINEKVQQGWTPDVIIGRNETKINCSMRTLYRHFKENPVFDVKSLPMKGKRKPNGYQENRGKQAFRRTLDAREKEHPDYDSAFGHLEGDTIVGKNHKSAVITLVERISKLIIPLKVAGRQAINIQESLEKWLGELPKHLIKSITFDCGKEFSNWKEIANDHDIDIYFADPGCPSQRGLNENSNGLLRRDGLPKRMDFTEVTQQTLTEVANFRNTIPRKSLDYRTPIEVFLEQCDKLGYIEDFVL